MLFISLLIHYINYVHPFRCGLIVHENCYVTDNFEDCASSHSSSSTEPWFCEPCLYGLKEPPFCELCPSRYGAFKKSGLLS